MKKRILCLGVIAFAMFFAFSPVGYTYADDVHVSFKITNHKAEITVRNSSNKTDFELGDKVPDTIVTYKNAIRAVVKLIGPDGTILKTDDSTLDLTNENRNKLIDFSEVEFEGYGEYKIISSGFNVDGDETVGNEIVFKIKDDTVEVPNTGGAIGLMQDFIKNDLLILLTTIAVIASLVIVVKIKKGARNEK